MKNLFFLNTINRTITYFEKVDYEEARKLLQLLVLPFILSTGICLLWYFIKNILKVPLSEGNTYDAWSSNLGFTYTVIVGLILQKVDSRHEEFTKSIHPNTKDRDTYLYLRDLRLSIVWKGLNGIFSIMIIYHIFIMPFESTFIAISKIFSVSFGTLLIIEIARELDSRFHGVWHFKITDLPKEWQKDEKMLPKIWRKNP